MSKLKLPASIKKPNFKNKRIIGLTIVVLAVLVGVGWMIFGDKVNKSNSKIYAQAAGHKIYEDEVRDLKGNNQEISNHDAAGVLADKYLSEELAKEQNITVSDQEIEAQWGKGIEKQKIENKYAYQNKVNQAYFNKLTANNRGIYKGKFLVAHFSRHVPYKSALLPEEKAADPKLGNSLAIAKDKKYAQDLITRLRDNINSGKITFEQAMKIEQNDPIVGKKVYPTLGHSGMFDTASEPFELIDINSIRQNGKLLQTGQTSGPFIVRASDSENGDSTAESYFVIINLDSASGGGAKTGFKQYIEEAKKRLEYNVYV